LRIEKRRTEKWCIEKWRKENWRIEKKLNEKCIEILVIEGASGILDFLLYSHRNSTWGDHNS